MPAPHSLSQRLVHRSPLAAIAGSFPSSDGPAKIPRFDLPVDRPLPKSPVPVLGGIAILPGFARAACFNRVTPNRPLGLHDGHQAVLRLDNCRSAACDRCRLGDYRPGHARWDALPLAGDEPLGVAVIRTKFRRMKLEILASGRCCHVPRIWGRRGSAGDASTA